jgi:hypothetical protein
VLAALVARPSIPAINWRPVPRPSLNARTSNHGADRPTIKFVHALLDKAAGISRDSHVCAYRHDPSAAASEGGACVRLVGCHCPMTSLIRTSINPERIGMRHGDDIVAAIDKMDLARHAGREV